MTNEDLLKMSRKELAAYAKFFVWKEAKKQKKAVKRAKASQKAALKAETQL